MLVLFETPAGHALFQLLDATKLKKPDSLAECFADADKCRKLCVARPRDHGRLAHPSVTSPPHGLQLRQCTTFPGRTALWRAQRSGAAVHAADPARGCPLAGSS